MVATSEQAAVALERVPSVSRVGAAVRLISFTRTGTIGASVVGIFLLLAIFAPLISPADPNFQELTSRARFISPQHLLGTDLLGRDMLSRSALRLAHLADAGYSGGGARRSCSGMPFGLIAGYAGGYLDMIIMRGVDILLAFPLYLLAIIIIAILGPSLPNMILAVGISSAPRFARLARGDVLTAKRLDFVFAAEALGAPSARIVSAPHPAEHRRAADRAGQPAGRHRHSGRGEPELRRARATAARRRRGA